MTPNNKQQKKNSIIFYRDWFNAINQLKKKADMADAYRAIVGYALNGEVDFKMSNNTRMMLTMVRTNIDANNARYQKTIDRRKKENPSEETNDDANGEDSFYGEITNFDGSKIDTTSAGAEQKPQTRLEQRKAELIQDDSPYGRFNKWLIEKVPYIVEHYDHLFSEEEFYSFADFEKWNVHDIILQIDNRSDLRAKYNNLFRSVRNWMEKEH